MENIVSFKHCESLEAFNTWKSANENNGAIVFINDSTGKHIWAQGVLYSCPLFNIAVVNELPSSPDSATIYFVK